MTKKKMDSSSPWPQYSAETECERCRSIYWNLFEMFSNKDAAADGALVVRELAHTTRCDTLFNFTKEREGIREEIGDDESLRRIMRGSPTDDDKFRASVAVSHYDYWMRKQLWHCLTPRDKLYYFTVHKFYETVSVFGIIGGSGGLLYKWGSNGRAKKFATQFMKKSSK